MTKEFKMIWPEEEEEIEWENDTFLNIKLDTKTRGKKTCKIILDLMKIYCIFILLFAC